MNEDQVKLTYEDVIKQTVDYYSEDVSRRSITQNKCMYFDEITGNMCAVGRCLENLQNFQHYEGRKASYIIKDLNYNIFKKEYQHLQNNIFWNRLQTLHDTSLNWTENGLSETGLKYVDELILEYRTMELV